MKRMVLCTSVCGVLASLALCLGDAGERAPVTGGGWRVKTSDGLEVTFAKDATISRVAVDGRELPLRGKGGFYVTEVLPPDGKRKSYGLVTGQVRDVKGGRGDQRQGRPRGWNCTRSSRTPIGSTSGGDVRDTTGKDRALIVEFVLPVDCTGWTYENTPLQRQVIGKDTRYPSLQQPDSMLVSDTSPPDERDNWCGWTWAGCRSMRCTTATWGCPSGYR